MKTDGRVRRISHYLLVTLLPLILLTLSAGILIKRQIDAVNVTGLELTGAAHTQLLQDTMMSLQQVRGLSQMRKVSADGTNERLTGLRERLSKQLETLALSEATDRFGMGEEVAAFRDRLMAELVRIQAQPQSMNFERLSGFVEQLQALIQQSGERSHLVLDSQLDSYYLMDLVINRIPVLIEAVSRLRGVVSGLVASRTESERIDLIIDLRLETVNLEMEAMRRNMRVIAQRNPAVSRVLELPVGQFELAMDRLLKEVRSHTGNEAAMVFFDQATDAIDYLFALQNHIRRELTHLLEIRRIQQKSVLAYSSIGFTITAVLLCYFFITFFRRESALIGRIEEAGEYNQALVDNLPCLFYMISPKGRIVRWNREFQRVAGYSGDELARLHSKELVAPQELKHVVHQMKEVYQHGSISFEFHLLTRSGDLVPLLTTVFRDHQNDEINLMGIAIDISERKALEQRLEWMATTDPLTGIANRARFTADLEKIMDQAQRYRRPFSIITLDIDHFKRINDQFGHEVGDRVLKSLVEVTREGIRQVDTLYRYGGEEFQILLPETGLEGAGDQAERLRTRVESVEFSGVGGVTISLGVAEYRFGEEPRELLKRADDALYQAKHNGRNRVERSVQISRKSG